MNKIQHHADKIVENTLVPRIKRAIQNDYEKTHNPYTHAMRTFNLNSAVQYAKRG